MPQKLSLKEAGKLCGVSAGAMRARARKSPAQYPVERDNAGKLWLVLSEAQLSELKGAKPGAGTAARLSMQPAMQGRTAGLEAALAAETARADAAERARDQAEGERDRWRQMAEKLAERPARRWWPF